MKEIVWSKSQRFDYFYAGYVLGRGDSMDYKLRPGGVEWLERGSGQWRPWQEEAARVDPMAQSTRRLEEVHRLVPRLSLSMRRYEAFSVCAAGEHLATCLAYPVILTRDHGPGKLVLGWDPVAQRYELVRCAVGALRTADGARVLIPELFIVIHSLGTFRHAEQAAHAMVYPPDVLHSP
jgi:hypothetical protein